MSSRIKPRVCILTQTEHDLGAKPLMFLLWSIVSFLHGGLFAQQTTDSTAVSTEVVDVVKSYTPSINLRPKSKWDIPSSKNTSTLRPEFSYGHEYFDFVPSELPGLIRAMGPKKERAQENLPNYLRVQLGTRESAVLEGFLMHPLKRDDFLSLAFDHQQLNGPIEGIVLPVDWSESSLRAQWRSTIKNRLSTLGLAINRSTFQWYGIPDTLDIAPELKDDFGQNYLRGRVFHRLGSNGGWFTGLDNELSVFSDGFGVTEWSFSSAPKAELIWDKRLVSITGNLSLLSTKLSLEDALITTEDYSALNIDLGAQTDFNVGDLMLHVGTKVWTHSGGSGRMFRLFPELELSHPILGRNLGAYFTFGGQYHQNKMSALTQTLGFLVPGIPLKPQVDRQLLQLGINGAFSDLWQYNFGVAYRNFEDQVYFKRRPWSGQQGSFAYDNGNSFTVDYDDGTELKYTAKINGRLTARWDVSLDAAWTDNRPVDNIEPWNIPAFTFGGSAGYHLNDKILLTGRFMSYGPRSDEIILVDQTITQEVKGFIDTQLHVNYSISKNFSASLSGINLLNQQNGLWANYPVQGMRVNLGLQYNFRAF